MELHPKWPQLQEYEANTEIRNKVLADGHNPQIQKLETRKGMEPVKRQTVKTTQWSPWFQWSLCLSSVILPQLLLTDNNPNWIRRSYELAALVAVRQARTFALLWARQCRRSTTLGAIAFSEMARHPGRRVIAASASLLVGSELVAKSLSALERAAIVTREPPGFARETPIV
jgi:hypothetical protein